MQYIGVDIIEIARVHEAVERWGDRFLRRVYTESELKRYAKSPSSLAVRFAGKEAVVKALGTSEGGIGWKDIEILAESGDRPVVNLYRRAREQANELGLKEMAISLSHSRDYAIAFVVAEKR
ncbi:MAG: holo-ACP synthase [Dehalococcoidales bacterium]|nr:holo-ACP synthase [Dehalococcoidales bacterium]